METAAVLGISTGNDARNFSRYFFLLLLIFHILCFETPTLGILIDNAQSRHITYVIFIIVDALSRMTNNSIMISIS
jgi:hypothetical protein